MKIFFNAISIFLSIIMLLTTEGCFMSAPINRENDITILLSDSIVRDYDEDLALSDVMGKYDACYRTKIIVKNNTQMDIFGLEIEPTFVKKSNITLMINNLPYPYDLKAGKLTDEMATAYFIFDTRVLNLKDALKALKTIEWEIEAYSISENHFRYTYSVGFDK